MENKKDVYQIITDKVIEGVKEKGLQWFKTWNGTDCTDVPISYTTKKAYKGINHLLLSWDMERYDYEDNEFITINQAKKLGGTIKKGSKRSMIVFYNVSFKDTDTKKYYRNEKELEKAGLDKHAPNIQSFFTPRYYNVFNVSCFDGLPKTKKKDKEKALEGTIFNKIDKAEDVWNGYVNSPKLSHRGDKAFYRPSTDSITMPKQTSFNTSDDYYKVLFHEAIHSTGHENRLKRSGVMGVARFGDDEYSKEELVAELGAMFLENITGIKSKENNSQAYINGWLERLENNPKWIINASSQSQRAVEHILYNK